MVKEIWFDMDGTFVDLYGNDNWLNMLINEDVKAYSNAKPLINMQVFARTLNEKIEQGYTINVVSWLSKNGSDTFNKKVIKAKKKWLKKHLKSVHFTRIDILPYGTPKEENRNGILFDDEEPNRNHWKGTAYNVNAIIGTLKGLE